MFFLQIRPHETLWFPRTVMTTEVGWTKVEKFLIWSPLQQGQSKSPLSSRAFHRQLMHTKLLHSVSGLVDPVSLHTAYKLTQQWVLKYCLAVFPCRCFIYRKERGRCNGVDMVYGTLGTYGGRTTGISAAPLGWSSSCAADLVKMVTNTTLIWEWLVHEKTPTPWWCCLPPSTAFLDLVKML